MIEKLCSCATLLSVGLMSHKEYKDILDTLFMKMPDNNLLLDLEYISSDINKTISTIRNHCTENEIDYAVFGCFLMKGLSKAYYDSGIEINDFGNKAYAIWTMLPSIIDSIEPFFTMNYADDPLFWGDVAQTRKLYEKMFIFYDK